MCELKVTKEIFGDDVAKYLANKHRGGQNGRKGTIYEDWYAAFRLAEQFYLRVVEGDCSQVQFEGQCMAFVDDLAVYRENATEFYQLKNTISLGWASGDHPIDKDFGMQIMLATALGYPSPLTGLVCSDADVAKGMSDAIPAAVDGHTSVCHFPYDSSESTYGVLQANGQLRNAVAKISRYAGDEATLSKIGVTLDVLMGAWRALGVGRHSIDDVVNKCIENQPAAFRLEVADEEIRASLPKEFFEVLDNIPGLSYDIVRGYFVWSFSTVNGQKLSSGSPQNSCRDGEFRHFCSRVLDQRPSTIDELEELL